MLNLELKLKSGTDEEKRVVIHNNKLGLSAFACDFTTSLIVINLTCW